MADNHISLELNFIMGNKVHGRIKRKHVRYFTLKNMTHDEYMAARDIIMTGMEPIGQKFLDLGYTMEFRGEPIVQDAAATLAGSAGESAD